MTDVILILEAAMFPITLGLVARLAAIALAASAPLVAARRKGPHVLAAIGVLLGALSAIANTRVGEFGFPLESQSGFGYTLSLEGLALSYLPAAFVIHVASVWRARPRIQALLGGAVLATGLFVGVGFWVA